MNKGITQRQAFSHLLKGTKIRRKRWPDDNWIQYIRTGNQCELHTYWTGPTHDNESIAIPVLHGLLAWDDWEIVE
jgi:hypothetical protein